MNDELSNTIEVLTTRVRAKEEEANKLKRLINELCSEAGIEIRFPGITENGGTISAIRSDEYYGQPLTAAIRNYLERRKTSGLGAATLSEIFNAVREGGYKFDTRNDENAKIGVGNALRKTTSVFHRLPNGQYGLLTWYPNAKARLPESEGREHTEPGSRAAKRLVSKILSNTVTNGEIREIVLAQEGEFQNSSIEAIVKAKYPSKELPKSKIPTVIFILKKKGLVKELSPKSGSKPAAYAKA
jgi:hypothetical protein